MIKEQYPAIEWRRMAQMRDRIIHHYFDINWKLVWDVIRIAIPALEPKHSAIIHHLDAKSDGAKPKGKNSSSGKL